MSIKRLLGAIAFRTLLIGSLVTGLSFLFPSAIIPFIGAGALTLVTSVIVSVVKCKRQKYFDDIPAGDLEYYELPESSFYNKIETKVLDAVENIPNKTKKKKSENEDTLSL